MGFTRHVVEKALKEIGDDTIRPEIIVTWLLDHPEIAVSFSCSNPCLQLTFSMLINLFPTFLCVISSKWCRGFLIESFPQMCFEGKWLQNQLRADKMSRDHFWRSIFRDTNVEVSALSPVPWCRG